VNIIGLGRAGCQIARNFKNYEQYKVFCIDVENKAYPTFLSVEVQNSHEDYEKKYKKLNLSKCEGETTLILCGAGKISGCVLQLLDQLQKLPIKIIYIKSDETMMSGLARTRDKIVLGVLQEYARSNILEKIYIVSNKNVEAIVGDVTIKSYWDEINNVITSTYHMINVFEKTEPLLTNDPNMKETIKIGTLGVVNFETGNERAFYDLQFPRVKNYFYGINKEAMGNKKILNKVRNFVDSKKEEKLDVGFSIYPTDYDDNYVYSTHYASYIQEQNLD
jgi:hypothetical protein